MKARFDEVRPTLRPTAKLAEAIDYVLNRWDAFVRYTGDGRIPIDNNVIERLLRPVAIGRKNELASILPTPAEEADLCLVRCRERGE
jgi:hypothetical protein